MELLRGLLRGDTTDSPIIDIASANANEPIP